MKVETAKKLVEPFDRSKLKTTQGMTYIPIAEVVARMNEAVGVGRWRVEILDTQSWGERATLQGVSPTHIIASVRVHVADDETGEWTWSDGMGGQDVGFHNTPREKWWRAKKYNKQQGDEPNGPDADTIAGPLNLGDNYKGACSDATKKALQHLGVGLELARDGAVVEVIEPTISLVAEINEKDDADVPRFSDAEKKALAAEWKRRFSFKASAVPESMVDEARTLIASFEGTDIPTEPETNAQERSDEVAVAIDLPGYEVPMTEVEAKDKLTLCFEQVHKKKQDQRREAFDIWQESGYQGIGSIGAIEWSVLMQFTKERIEQLIQEKALA